MKALLIRIGIDHSYGGWNAPADPATREFVYIPIPENESVTFHPDCECPYTLTLPALQKFAVARKLDVTTDLRMPAELERRMMHLDPDFKTLTYGDVGNRRGAEIPRMAKKDFVVFYAGLRSTQPPHKPLVYAMVGIFFVDEVVLASQVNPSRWNENAHTRKSSHGAHDVIIRARSGSSGRLRRYIPIGEYRDRAYRVRHDLLDAWGGLTVNNGYIQRSAVPPRFLEPRKFLQWLESQDIELLQSNW